MTKDKALDIMGATLDDWVDKKNMAHLIGKIYDYFEEELKKAYIEGGNDVWKALNCKELAK